MHIPDNSDLYFESDSAIEKRLARSAAVNYDKGRAIKMPTKILSIALISDDDNDIIIAAGDSLGCLSFVSLKFKRTIREIKNFHNGPISTISYCKKFECLVSGSWDKSIKVLLNVHSIILSEIDLNSSIFGIENAHGDTVKTIFPSHDLAEAAFVLFSGGFGGDIKMWKIDLMQKSTICISSLKISKRPIEKLFLDPSARILYTSSSDSTLKAFHISSETFQEIQNAFTKKHQSTITAFSSHNESTEKKSVFSADTDGYLIKWDTSDIVSCGSLIDWERNFKNAIVKSIAFTKAFACVGLSTGLIEIIPFDSSFKKEHYQQLIGHFDVVTGILSAFNATVLVSSSLDGTIRSWEISSEKDVLSKWDFNEDEDFLSSDDEN